ncbi:MAG: CYTH domain-containing protein [Treponema sp.]|jgi:adenylate cyclase class 2|nr:CYTH domain-containing protein [Treponema sp.]
MAFEIELKVRLENPDQIKLRLSALGTYYHSYEKSDIYWFRSKSGVENSLLPSGVRIRQERGLDADGSAYETVIVTYKIKQLMDKIEINDEREFIVSDVQVFEELLRRLGLDPDIQKEKQGWAWNIPPETAGQPPILAELSMVKNLGWFLELEIIASSNSGQVAEESRKRLFSLLEKLEIPAKQIESRPYTQMLRELAR